MRGRSGSIIAADFCKTVRWAAFRAADILLPRLCAVCGRRLGIHERHLCLSCMESLPRTRFSLRARNPMADRLNAAIDSYRDEAADSGTGFAGKAGCEEYSYATALFFYDPDSGYSRISQELKYHGNIPLGRVFGRMLGKDVAGRNGTGQDVPERYTGRECSGQDGPGGGRPGHFADVDLVVPVPLHWARRYRRGFNQSEVLAREVAAELGCPCRTDLVRRCRRTRSQTSLSREQKRLNAAGAFEGRLDRIAGAFGTPDGDLKSLSAQHGGPRWPRHILLVDDVFTSGSTLASCHMALKDAFRSPGHDVRISAATLAFVGGL